MFLVNKLVSRIKGQEYAIDERITLASLISIIMRRVYSLIRGFFKCFFVGKKGKFIFVGRNVKLVHSRKIRLGSGVTLSDFAEIDALSKDGVVLGNNVMIGTHTIIRCTGSLKKLGKGLKIGDNCGTGDFCFFGSAGGISIGDNVIMGQNVRFHSENHIFDRTDLPIKSQGVTNKGIEVGNDCWIGSGAVFLDGVKVGNGCVIGANSLVNKDIPDYSIAVGNPVRVIKNRLENVE